VQIHLPATECRVSCTKGIVRARERAVAHHVVLCTFTKQCRLTAVTGLSQSLLPYLPFIAFINGKFYTVSPTPSVTKRNDSTGEQITNDNGVIYEMSQAITQFQSVRGKQCSMTRGGGGTSRDVKSRQR
jgi:hypothetical protein